MSKIHCYIAGPMRGYKDFNFPAFDKAAAYLREAGFEVFSPAEKETEKHSEANQESLAFRRLVFALDMAWICKHADLVALLPGWEKSSGARAEKALAEAIGLEVRFIDPETGALTDATAL